MDEKPVKDSEVDPLARKVIEIIAEKGGKPASAIGLDSTFEELGFDSLDGINILFALEDSFAVSIPDTIAQEITSIRMAVEKLRPLVEGAPG